MRKEKCLKMIIGGSGGQGILTLGKVFSYAGINRDLNVSCLPTYGAEMRGGYIFTTLVFSSENKILSPVVSKADIGIFMDEKSYRMLLLYIKNGGCIFLNSSFIKKISDKKYEIFEIPASEMAEKIGNLQVANMVIGGAAFSIIAKEFFPFTFEDIIYGIEEVISEKYNREISKKAVSVGWEMINSK